MTMRPLNERYLVLAGLLNLRAVFLAMIDP
jgi:hypothetical protein